MSAVATDDRLTALRAQAVEAMRQAYAPYSKFRVGAALLTDAGETFVGCNVENASYPAGLCAERVALGAAVAAGHRKFVAIAICSEAAAPAGPVMRWSLAELLPHPFTPSSLHS